MSKSSQKRCAIYTRVSTKEQADEGFSLDSQLILLRNYASAQDLHVEGEYCDSESGAKGGRTAFSKMLRDVADRGLSAIVVEKTDRLARNFADIVKVDELGVEIHFVKEGMVVSEQSKSSDKFIYSIKVALAKHFSDNLREEVKKGMVEKARQGLWPSTAPFGYLNVTRGGQKLIEPDPDRAWIVKRLFEEYAARRVSMDGLHDLATSLGLRTPRGHTYARSSLHRMLSNPVYMGIVEWGGIRSAGLHEPIITANLFEQAQDVLSGRKTNRGNGTVDYAFKGLIECGHCGCSYTAETKKGRYVYYRCTGARNPRCPGKRVINEHLIEAKYCELLDRLTLQPEQLEWLTKGLEESLAGERALQEKHRRQLESNTRKLRDQLERLYLDRVRGEVPETIYSGLRQRLEAEHAEAELLMRSMATAERSYYDAGIQILELAKTASARFKSATKEQKRSLLLDLQSNCIITGDEMRITLRQPFQTFIEVAEIESQNDPKVRRLENWYSRRDSNPRSSP